MTARMKIYAEPSLIGLPRPAASPATIDNCREANRVLRCASAEHALAQGAGILSDLAVYKNRDSRDKLRLARRFNAWVARLHELAGEEVAGA